MSGTPSTGELPTDDDRPERRRRRSLIVASIGVTLLIASLLVLFAKPNPKLHPVAAPSSTTTTTMASGDYATEVAAANTTLAGLLALAGSWDATSTGMQSDLGTANSQALATLTALKIARAAHRAKPQNCAAVASSSSQVRTLTTSVIATADSVSTRATQILDGISESQPQVDQLTAQIAAAGSRATPAQLTALQSLQVSASSLGARRTAFSQTMTTIRGKADAASTNARTLAGQAATLAAGCDH